MCDHALPEVEHHVGADYDDLFADFLNTAAYACDIAIELSFYDAVRGSLPTSVNLCDAWVLSGSQHDAYADDIWIENLRAFVREVIGAEGRVAGICFGHQLVATAMGGSVGPSDHWSVGPQRLVLAGTPWFAEAEVHLHAMHRDIVTALPPGATSIGEGTTAALPAFLLGNNVLCVQDHPELPAPFVTALIEAHVDEIDADTIRRARENIRQQPTDGPKLGEMILRFLSDDRIDTPPAQSGI